MEYDTRIDQLEGHSPENCIPWPQITEGMYKAQSFTVIEYSRCARLLIIYLLLLRLFSKS